MVLVKVVVLLRVHRIIPTLKSFFVLFVHCKADPLHFILNNYIFACACMCVACIELLNRQTANRFHLFTSTQTFDCSRFFHCHDRLDQHDRHTIKCKCAMKLHVYDFFYFLLDI